MCRPFPYARTWLQLLRHLIPRRPSFLVSDAETRCECQRQPDSPHPINEIIQGKTTLRILRKCQTPKTQYELHVRWRSSNSCHRRTYQSWHHSEWILAAQKKGLVSGPSNHLASLEIVCPFLRSPKRLLGKFQFWLNGMEHNHPERQLIASR